jgi:hypothetical protein
MMTSLRRDHERAQPSPTPEVPHTSAYAMPFQDIAAWTLQGQRLRVRAAG